MDCAELQRALEVVELSESELDALGAHLDVCMACQSALAEHESVFLAASERALRALVPPAPGRPAAIDRAAEWIRILVDTVAASIASGPDPVFAVVRGQGTRGTQELRARALSAIEGRSRDAMAEIFAELRRLPLESEQADVARFYEALHRADGGDWDRALRLLEGRHLKPQPNARLSLLAAPFCVAEGEPERARAHLRAVSGKHAPLALAWLERLDAAAERR